MARHLESGKWGEQQALRYLKEQGYQIISLNWRSKHTEIDIVAKDAETLVFVEVKARRSTPLGTAETCVDHKTPRFLIQAADAYLEQAAHRGEIRVDLVSVYLQTGEIELNKDAFWSN